MPPRHFRGYKAKPGASKFTRSHYQNATSAWLVNGLKSRAATCAGVVTIYDANGKAIATMDPLTRERRPL